MQNAYFYTTDKNHIRHWKKWWWAKAWPPFCKFPCSWLISKTKAKIKQRNEWVIYILVPITRKSIKSFSTAVSSLLFYYRLNSPKQEFAKVNTPHLPMISPYIILHDCDVFLLINLPRLHHLISDGDNNGRCQHLSLQAWVLRQIDKWGRGFRFSLKVALQTSQTALVITTVCTHYLQSVMQIRENEPEPAAIILKWKCNVSPGSASGLKCSNCDARWDGTP